MKMVSHVATVNYNMKTQKFDFFFQKVRNWISNCAEAEELKSTFK